MPVAAQAGQCLTWLEFSFNRVVSCYPDEILISEVMEYNCKINGLSKRYNVPRREIEPVTCIVIFGPRQPLTAHVLFIVKQKREILGFSRKPFQRNRMPPEEKKTL